jgi:AcrR family transcriptional regulator
MSRQRSQERLNEIAEAALMVFTRLGYKNAQVADIAVEAGVSVGTLYLYAENKEALFWLAVKSSKGEDLPAIQGGPVPSRPLSDILQEIGAALQLASHSPLLLRCAARARPDGPIDEEMRSLLQEHYDDMDRSHRRVRLIEASAKNWPELAELFYARSRSAFIDLWTAYLGTRIEAGFLRRVPDTAVAARVIIETVAWFAMHRYGDPDGGKIPGDMARSTVVDILLNGLLCPEIRRFR